MEPITKIYTAKDEHIDFQNIMDGLYYPFYMEQCRHDFIEDVLEFDMKENASNGINMVIAEYTIKFFRPLKAGDTFEVTCGVKRKLDSSSKLIFEQQITIGGKIYTKGDFIVTCVSSNGGRPFIPGNILSLIEDK